MFAADEKGGPSAIKCEGIESDEGVGSFPLCLLLFSLFRNRTFSRSHRNQKRVNKKKAEENKKQEKEPETGRRYEGKKRTGDRRGGTEEPGRGWRGETRTERGEFSERTTKFPRAGLHKPQGRRSLFLHLVPPSAPPATPCPTHPIPLAAELFRLPRP